MKESLDSKLELLDCATVDCVDRTLNLIVTNINVPAGQKSGKNMLKKSAKIAISEY